MPWDSNPPTSLPVLVLSKQVPSLTYFKIVKISTLFLLAFLKKSIFNTCMWIADRYYKVQFFSTSKVSLINLIIKRPANKFGFLQTFSCACTRGYCNNGFVIVSQNCRVWSRIETPQISIWKKLKENCCKQTFTIQNRDLSYEVFLGACYFIFLFVLFIRFLVFRQFYEILFEELKTRDEYSCWIKFKGAIRLLQTWMMVCWPLRLLCYSNGQCKCKRIFTGMIGVSFRPFLSILRQKD